MFNQDRDSMRQYFLETWQKARNNEPMDQLQTIIARIIERHPEYHDFLQKGEDAIAKEFLPEMGESNPFLHLGMHIGLHEQLSTNRPQGIVSIYKKMIKKFGDDHAAEHEMMESLGEMIWSAQRENRLPDEQDYLRSLRARLAK